MPAVHFTNLLIVVAVGCAAPLILGFFPRLRLPAIVLEIVLGIVIGPSGLGWAKPDLPVSILSLIGLAFLLFLAGLEVDVERLRGRVLRLAALGFSVSFGIAVLVGLGLHAGGFVKSPLFVAIVLVATSLGVIVPVLKDSGQYQLELWSTGDHQGLDRGVRLDHSAVAVFLREASDQHGWDADPGAGACAAPPRSTAKSRSARHAQSGDARCGYGRIGSCSS
jgi:hypothetical protein